MDSDFVSRNRLMTFDEAQKALGLSRTQFYRKIKSGLVRTIRIGNRRYASAKEIRYLVELHDKIAQAFVERSIWPQFDEEMATLKRKREFMRELSETGTA